MPTIVVETYTGSTYTIRHAPEVPGHPAAIHHSKGVYQPPETSRTHGAFEVLHDGFEFTTGINPGAPRALCLRVPGFLATSSPIVSITTDGVTIPIPVRVF